MAAPETMSLMLKNRLRIQHLETLISIGRHRNAHRAARELSISQPAVSKIIQEVEEIFGAILFERGRGGMIPNLVGEALIARAVALINDIGRTHDEIEAIAAGQIGSLRLGVIAFIAPTLISLSLNRLAAENVSLRLEIHEGTTPPLVQQLLSNELDCIIGRYSPEEESRLDQTLLSQQHFAVVVSSLHPILRHAKSIELAHTVPYEWIATPPRTSARQALTSMFTRAGLRVPAVKIKTASTEIMKAALLDCQMIGLLPEGIARRYVEAEQLQILPFAIDYPPAPLMLIRRRNETALPSVERFCQTLLDVAKQLEVQRVDIRAV